MHRQEEECQRVGWIQLSQDKVPWRAQVRTARTFVLYERRGFH
jgi:hypothetical protein